MRPALWHNSGRLYLGNGVANGIRACPYGVKVGGFQDGNSLPVQPSVCVYCVSAGMRGSRGRGSVVVLANASLYITKMMESSPLDIIQ